MNTAQPSTDPGSPAAAGAAAWASSVRLWFWAGLAFVAAAIALLEAIDPYFFCQDDALVLEMPVVLSTLRSVWQGVQPRYEPFIFLGSPTPAIAGVYPPMYAAYGIARHLLGDEYATFDVFAAIHLLAGYCLTFVVARRLGIGPVLAALAGLTFVLSGPVLVMARCWHSFSVLAVFIPLLALLADWLRTGPVGWWWPVATGLTLGLYYHAGFPQIFVLGCGAMLMQAIAACGAGLVPRRRLAWLAPALAFGAAIAFPVFYQQWRLSREMSIDDPGGGTGVESNLLSMLLPYPLVRGTLPNDWGNANLEWGGHFFYFGTVLLVGFLAAALELARVAIGGRTGSPAAARRLRWCLVIPAVVALLLALGEWGGLWWLMGLLPVGLRNNPFRALPWFVFFACLTGAAFLDGALAPRGAAEGSRRDDRLKLLAAVAGTGVVLVALHLTRAGISFYAYGFRPYPELPPPLAKLLEGDGPAGRRRIMSFAAMRSTDPSYPLALPHNLPCEYGVPTFFGYDPLVQRFGRYQACVKRVMDAPRESLAAYGVRWLLAHRTTWGGWRPQTPNPFERVLPFVGLLKELGNNRQESLGDLDELVAVIEIPNAAPLAFDAARPTEALPLNMSGLGLAIALVPEPEPRKIVANFLAYPDMAATADGRPAAVSEDEWQRIVVAAPAGTKDIAIRYAPPRGTGIAIAAVLAILGAAATAACRLLRV